MSFSPKSCDDPRRSCPRGAITCDRYADVDRRNIASGASRRCDAWRGTARARPRGPRVRAPCRGITSGLVAVLRHRRAERRRRFRVARSSSAAARIFACGPFSSRRRRRRRTCFHERILLPAARSSHPSSPPLTRSPARASGFLASDGYLIVRAIHTEFEGANREYGLCPTLRFDTGS